MSRSNYELTRTVAADYSLAPRYRRREPVGTSPHASRGREHRTANAAAPRHGDSLASLLQTAFRIFLVRPTRKRLCCAVLRQKMLASVSDWNPASRCASIARGVRARRDNARHRSPLIAVDGRSEFAQAQVAGICGGTRFILAATGGASSAGLHGYLNGSYNSVHRAGTASRAGSLRCLGSASRR